ncbi:hypothetical protein FBU30_009368 [Linnemannia zychae]|nr:hypothetical protein FBU30_009368 [Linnemannia zychae]
MGYDYCTVSNITAIGIPVPIEALQKPFDLGGFKLMVVVHVHYNKERNLEYLEYHGAIICLEDTQLHYSSIDIVNAYDLTENYVNCKRMEHLDTYMPSNIRGILISAFESYTGHKPKVMPGFWSILASGDYVELHTTWSLGADEVISDGSCERFWFFIE